MFETNILRTQKLNKTLSNHDFDWYRYDLWGEKTDGGIRVLKFINLDLICDVIVP